MRDGKYIDVVLEHLVRNVNREVPESDPTNISWIAAHFHQRKAKRLVCDFNDRLLEESSQPICRRWIQITIPGDVFVNFDFRLIKNDKVHSFARSFAEGCSNTLHNGLQAVSFRLASTNHLEPSFELGLVLITKHNRDAFIAG